jgi:hypothetical protein
LSTRTIDAPAPLTLAERLDAARKAEAAPQQRAAELEAAVTAAIERRDFAEAARLEPEVQAAREAAALAAAATRALAEGAAAVGADRERRQSARDKAERQVAAQQVIAEALTAEQVATTLIAQHLDVMWRRLTEAKAAFGEALEAEMAAGRAYRQVLAGRVAAGESEGMPTYISTANDATVVGERDELVRVLRRWRP